MRCLKFCMFRVCLGQLLYSAVFSVHDTARFLLDDLRSNHEKVACFCDNYSHEMLFGMYVQFIVVVIARAR